MDDAQLQEKLDKLLRVTTRTETQVEALVAQDSHTRICTLESAHKFWKALVIAVPSFGGLVLGLLKAFDKI